MLIQEEYVPAETYPQSLSSLICVHHQEELDNIKTNDLSEYRKRKEELDNKYDRISSFIYRIYG